jgi:Imidazolonepropionase and related amidohydrolases
VLSALRVGVLIDGTGAPAVEDAVVRLAGDRIRSVEAAGVSPLDSSAADAATADIPPCTLIPGLIDAHVHLAWAYPERPEFGPSAADAGRWAGWAVASAMHAMQAGVLTLRDCGSPDGVALTVRDTLRAFAAPVPNLLACGPAVTTTAGHGAFIGVTADSAAELIKVCRELVLRSPDALKLMVTGGSMDPHTNRRVPQYSQDEIDAFVREATRFDLPVIAHANATEGIRRAVVAGVGTIAHCNFLSSKPGRIDVDAALVAEMDRRGVYVDLNLAAALSSLVTTDAQAHVGEPDLSANRWELLRRHGRLTERTFFTSDKFGPHVAQFPALVAETMRTLGLSAENAIWRATGLPAQACRLPDRGTVAAGQIADLVVLDGDLRSDPTALLRPRLVLRAGVPVAGIGRSGDVTR